MRVVPTGVYLECEDASTWWVGEIVLMCTSLTSNLRAFLVGEINLGDYQVSRSSDNRAEDSYVDPYFTIDKFKEAHALEIAPIPGKDQWVHIDTIAISEGEEELKEDGTSGVGGETVGGRELHEDDFVSDEEQIEGGE
ncbi:hypothetical protein Tco_1525257 [Tanacetum coccineum]